MSATIRATPGPASRRACRGDRTARDLRAAYASLLAGALALHKLAPTLDHHVVSARVDAHLAAELRVAHKDVIEGVAAVQALADRGATAMPAALMTRLDAATAEVRVADHAFALELRTATRPVLDSAATLDRLTAELLKGVG